MPKYIPRFTSMSESNNNLQVLGGLLIVLSLALLYCWSQKKSRDGRYSRYEGMKSYADPHRSQFEGMRSKNVPGLNFNDNLKQSMHDLEGLSVNRHTPSELQRNSDIVGLKWKTEGMDTCDMTAMFDVDYDDARAVAHGYDSMSDDTANQPISGDILTPMKPSIGSACATHSHDQLTMTDTAMNYGRHGTTWAEARNSSVVSF